MSQSIGLLEVKSLLVAVEAIDVMVKSASVVVEGYKIMGETILVVISGDYKKVSACVEVGYRQAQSFQVHVTKHVIAVPHPKTTKVLDALLPSNTFSNQE